MEITQKVKVYRKNLIFLAIVFLFVGCAEKGNDTTYKSEEKNYISNNQYNHDFEYDDIETAEQATYNKYITTEAEQQIPNQKVFVTIKSTGKFYDNSTATSNKYTFIATDQDGNQWKLISKSKINIMKNIKVYGTYKGVEESENKKLPIIEIFICNMDKDYIESDLYTQI